MDSLQRRRTPLWVPVARREPWETSLQAISCRNIREMLCLLILRVHFAVYYFHLLGGELFGKPVLKSVKDIDHKVEGAVVVVAAKFAVDTVKDLMENGAKWITIITGGFKESKTPEGIAAQVYFPPGCEG